MYIKLQIYITKIIDKQVLKRHCSRKQLPTKYRQLKPIGKPL